MRTKRVFFLVVAILAIANWSMRANAQRRQRPGSMKHSAAEVKAVQTETKIKCKYVRDGAVFEGPAYRTGSLGGVKIGDCVIFFRGGRYALSFNAEKFKFKKHAVMSDAERARKGISKYEYENSFEYKKLGEDFDYSGKYTTVEQYHEQWLILYDGDSKDIFAKIPMNGADAQTLELNEDNFLIRLNYVK